MIIDRSKFILMAGALSVGGLSALGCENFGRAPAPPAPATVVQPSGPIEVTILQPAAVTGAPVCDDSQGTPEECPSVGPSDEGVCPNVITKRCNEFKAAMKPRVATQAVSCLRALKGNERCDPVRINHCGHASLMSACPERPRLQKGELQLVSGSQSGTVTIVADPTPDPSPVAVACSTILRSCGETPLNPTLADCRQTLAGLNDMGRANMVDCVSAHCADRGLHGCEAVPKAATASAAPSNL